MLNSDPARVLHDVFIDSVIAEIFRQPSTDPGDYITSATISERILNSGGGILYPSVRTMHAVNLAVRAEDFDTNFEVILSDVWKIDGYHGYGLYQLIPVKSTLEISAAGDFVWDSSRSTLFSHGLRRDLQIPMEFVGWRAQ